MVWPLFFHTPVSYILTSQPVKLCNDDYKHNWPTEGWDQTQWISFTHLFTQKVFMTRQGRRIDWQEHEGIFWGNENVLDLEEDVGYMGLHLSKLSKLYA